MLRPCFLVVDREQFGSISTRKLVIETAKFNVITAYSGPEAMATAEKYPNVDGVVMDAGMKDVPCPELIRQLRRVLPHAPIVVVGDSSRHACPGETIRLETFDPKPLLEVLQKLQPEKVAEIEEREKALNPADE